MGIKKQILKVVCQVQSSNEIYHSFAGINLKRSLETNLGQEEGKGYRYVLLLLRSLPLKCWTSLMLIVQEIHKPLSLVGFWKSVPQCSLFVL